MENKGWAGAGGGGGGLKERGRLNNFLPLKRGGGGRGLFERGA